MGLRSLENDADAAGNAVERRGGDLEQSEVAPAPPQSFWKRPMRAKNFEWLSAAGLGAAVGILIVIMTVESPFFLTESNFANIGRAIAYDGVVAAAMTIVLICGEIDLSVGAIISLGGIASAKALSGGFPGVVAILVALAVGLVAGAINAGLVVRLNVNPLICTIGTMFAFYGVAYIWANGNSLNAYGYSGFSYLGNGRIGLLYFPTVVLIGVFLALGLVLGQTRYGSQIYTIGGSRLAARRVGIRVDRIRTSVYLLSGLAAALGGIIIVSANGSASPASGTNDALVIISAVIIGGTALIGGRGNLFGTFLGVVFLGILKNGMDLVSIQAYWQMFVEGIVLIVAITIDEQFRRRGQRGEY